MLGLVSIVTKATIVFGNFVGVGAKFWYDFFVRFYWFLDDNKYRFYSPHLFMITNVILCIVFKQSMAYCYDSDYEGYIPEWLRKVSGVFVNEPLPPNNGEVANNPGVAPVIANNPEGAPAPVLPNNPEAQAEVAPEQPVMADQNQGPHSDSHEAYSDDLLLDAHKMMLTMIKNLSLIEASSQSLTGDILRREAFQIADESLTVVLPRSIKELEDVNSDFNNLMKMFYAIANEMGANYTPEEKEIARRLGVATYIIGFSAANDENAADVNEEKRSYQLFTDFCQKKYSKP